MAVSIIGGREGQVRWCSCLISRAGSYHFWEGTEAPAGDVTRPGWHSRPRSTGAGSPGSFSPPPWWQWGPSEPVRHRLVSEHHAQFGAPSMPQVWSLPYLELVPSLPVLTTSHPPAQVTISAAVLEKGGQRTPPPFRPAVVFRSLFCHVLFAVP